MSHLFCPTQLCALVACIHDVAVFVQLSCPWARVQESMHFYVCSYRLVSWGPPPASSSSSRHLPALWGWPAELIMESCPGEPNRCSKPQLQGVPSLGTWHMRELLHRPHMRELLHATSHAGIASCDLTCRNSFMGPHMRELLHETSHVGISSWDL